VLSPDRGRIRKLDRLGFMLLTLRFPAMAGRSFSAKPKLENGIHKFEHIE
jgi:hypothetical protein